MLIKLLVLFAVVACSKSDDKKPADPWATPPPPAGTTADPWAATPTAAPGEPEPAKPTPAEDPAPPPAPTGGTTTLAGKYQCQTLRYGTNINGMYRTSYVPSALGSFEIDADGAYRSASYPDKGSGRTHGDAASVTFEDGPYAGFIGEVGSNTTGAYIRFGSKMSEPPKPTMQFNDHVCYR